MAQTPISGVAAYCTPQQLTKEFDWRTLAELLSDDDVPLASKAAVEADANLAGFLKSASGEVEFALCRAGRYKPEDLNALVGTNAGEALAEIVAGLTIAKIYRRRPNVQSPLPPVAAEALETLERMNHGDWILPLQETADAGLLDDLTLDPVDYILGDGVVQQARPFFGVRANELRRRVS